MTRHYYSPRFLLLLAACAWWLVAAKSYRKRKDDNPHARGAKFLNRSGAKVDFFWVHPETGELAHSHTNGDGTLFVCLFVGSRPSALLCCANSTLYFTHAQQPHSQTSFWGE